MIRTTCADTRLWHVLPRGMRYNRADATSIDLFVSEMAENSRHSTTIFADYAGVPLPARELWHLPSHGFADTFRRATYVARQALRKKPDIVVVQQHLPAAGAIASLIAAPVVLQKHNFIRPPRAGAGSAAGRWHRHSQFNRLAGLTLVSESVASAFARDWPRVTLPRCIVPNGYDVGDWRPKEVREQTILVVGRATAEKGLLEAAQALAVVLPRHSGWTASLVVSESARDPSYMAALRHALAGIAPDRVKLLENQPFSTIRSLNESAAIALVPSIWQEPFGRTCLEAHAGAAAVISSGTGGLREISGDSALYLAGVSPEPIADALEVLMHNEELRHQIAARGQDRVARLFDIRRISGLLDDFCESLLERRPRLQND